MFRSIVTPAVALTIMAVVLFLVLADVPGPAQADDASSAPVAQSEPIGAATVFDVVLPRDACHTIESQTFLPPHAFGFDLEVLCRAEDGTYEGFRANIKRKSGAPDRFVYRFADQDLMTIAVR